jgi:hypothetical protein
MTWKTVLSLLPPFGAEYELPKTKNQRDELAGVGRLELRPEV